MTTGVMLELFEMLKAYAKREGIETIRYKAVPRQYHRLPADEDTYALFVHNAALVRVDVGSVIDLRHALSWSKGKRQNVAKAVKAGATVRRTHDFQGFDALLREVLVRHNAPPVHTAEELQLLASRFPDNIHLYGAFLPESEALMAAVLVFDCGNAVHTQYMASSTVGREIGALDLIIHHLQKDVFASRDFLSFGVSTEGGGYVLNRGLMAQKEMFGARAIVQPVYELRVD